MRGWQDAAMRYQLHNAINAPPGVRLLVGKRIGLWHVTNVEARQVAVEKVVQEGLAATRIHLPGDGGEIGVILLLGVRHSENEVPPRIGSSRDHPIVVRLRIITIADTDSNSLRTAF